MLRLETFLAGLPMLLDGTLVSLGLTLVTVICGAAVALPVALARNGRSTPARWLANGFIFLFRGAPLLVLLYLVYYGLPQFQWLRASPAWFLLREPYVCAVLALSLNSAGYVAPIISGALRAVPRGEVEAATAAGFGRLAVLRLVMLPHAARIALRSYGNEIIFVIKGTSVASLVTIGELMRQANAVYFNTYDPFTPFLTAGAIYLVLVFLVTRAIGLAERRLSPELRVGPRSVAQMTQKAAQPVAMRSAE